MNEQESSDYLLSEVVTLRRKCDEFNEAVERMQEIIDRLNRNIDNLLNAAEQHSGDLSGVLE